MTALAKKIPGDSDVLQKTQDAQREELRRAPMLGHHCPSPGKDGLGDQPQEGSGGRFTAVAVWREELQRKQDREKKQANSLVGLK